MNQPHDYADKPHGKRKPDKSQVKHGFHSTQAKVCCVLYNRFKLDNKFCSASYVEWKGEMYGSTPSLT